MIKIRTALTAAASLVAAATLMALPASAQTYGIGTGKQGFWTYSAGAAIAKVATDNGLNLRIQPYGGTSAYVPAVNAKEIEFGLANELETNYAVTGRVIYEGKPQPEVRIVAILSPLYSVLFVRKDSPIKTIADLKGKRVPSDFVSQRVLDVLVQGTLANAGLSYADVQKVPVPNVVGGANEFAEGKADTFMFALGAGAVAETDAKVGGVRVLPIDPSKEAMDRMRKFIPVAYPIKLEPRKGLVGILEPTMVYAYDYILLANSKVPDDVVYRLAKAMHANKDALAASFPALRDFNPKRMAKDTTPVQFHPGAIKFYQEVGQWPPKTGG
ncbi:MAG TPA: TAXI family TRAP transporter solute-binding subunit [Xanthobacteraceae bacterium]|nr:TAXI family TRAP transporter solute-binding subunit [Xanthobacteraceae bacterium]